MDQAIAAPSSPLSQSASSTSYFSIDRVLQGQPKLLNEKQPHTNLYGAMEGKIYYTDLRGKGPPPASAGNVGDIWLDKTAYILYSKRLEGWVAWNADLSKPQLLAPHPLYADRYLWVLADDSGFGWFTDQALRKRNPRIIPNSPVHALDSQQQARQKNAFGDRPGMSEMDPEMTYPSLKRRRVDMEGLDPGGVSSVADIPASIRKGTNTLKGVVEYMSALANTADEWKVSFEEQVNTTFQAVQDIEQLRTRSQKLSDDNEGLKLEIAALKAEALSFKIKTVSLEQELEEAREHDRNVTVRFTEEQKSRKIAEHELNDLRSKIKALAAGVTEK